MTHPGRRRPAELRNELRDLARSFDGQAGTPSFDEDAFRQLLRERYSLMSEAELERELEGMRRMTPSLWPDRST
jgi:hypothetical protein